MSRVFNVLFTYFFHLRLWNFYGISLRDGEINSSSFDIVSLIFFFFFFSNRNTAKIFEIFQIPQCFVFHIFYLVIENIFKRELKREKTDKNLKIDLANLYQNQIFQGTYTHIFTFILFIQHIDLSYRAARLSSMHIQTIETIKSFSGNSNSIIIRETYLEIFLPKKKKKERFYHRDIFQLGELSCRNSWAFDSVKGSFEMETIARSTNICPLTWSDIF